MQEYGFLIIKKHFLSNQNCPNSQNLKKSIGKFTASDYKYFNIKGIFSLICLTSSCGYNLSSSF